QNTVTRFNLVNASNGTGAATQISIGNDTSSTLFNIYTNGSGVTPNAYDVANRSVVEANGSAGLGLVARAASSTIQFYTGTSGIPKVIVDSSGNVGIGKPNPSEKLEVAGNINVTGDGTAPGNITLTGT